MDNQTKQGKELLILSLIIMQIHALLDILQCAIILIPPIISGDLNSFGDFRQQWLCAYTLNHVNPYLDKTSLSSTIGAIPDNFSTSPWGLVLGNIFYPAILSSRCGTIYILILTFICTLVTCIFIMKYFKHIDNAYIWYVPIIFIMSISLHMSILNRNASAVICCFIIFAVLYHKKFPILSGVLLGFALTKPQICGLVCLVFLFEKCFKILITAGIIDMIGFAITSYLLDTNPIKLLIQFFNSDVGYSEDGIPPFHGILSFLTLFNIDKSIIIIGSALIGITLTVYSYVRLKHVKINSDYIRQIIIFSPAIICSNFWSYGFNLDKTTISIVVLLLLFIFFKINTYSLSIYITISLLELSALAFQITNKLTGFVWIAGTTSSILLILGYMIFISLFTNNSFVDTINNTFDNINERNKLNDISK